MIKPGFGDSLRAFVFIDILLCSNHFSTQGLKGIHLHPRGHAFWVLGFISILLPVFGRIGFRRSVESGSRLVLRAELPESPNRSPGGPAVEGPSVPKGNCALARHRFLPTRAGHGRSPCGEAAMRLARCSP